MKTVRLCTYLLLYGTLLTPYGCEKAEFKTEDVVINNCGATPDTVQVREGDQVHWQASDHDYSVRFSNSSEPTANPLTIRHGASNPVHPIRGHRGCDDLGNGEFRCKYSLTRANENSPCADPGVHITR